MVFVQSRRALLQQFAISDLSHAHQCRVHSGSASGVGRCAHVVPLFPVLYVVTGGVGDRICGVDPIIWSGIFSYPLPYAYASVYGSVAACLFLLYAIRSSINPTTINLLWAGLWSAMALLMKLSSDSPVSVPSNVAYRPSFEAAIMARVVQESASCHTGTIHLRSSDRVDGVDRRGVIHYARKLHELANILLHAEVRPILAAVYGV